MDPHLALMLFGAFVVAWLPFDMHRRCVRRRRRTAVATGEVVGVETLTGLGIDGASGLSTFHARIAFATARGARGECVDPSGVSARRPAIGAPVEVAYDPEDPRNAVPVGGDQARVETLLGWVGIAVGAAVFAIGAMRG